MQSSDGFLYDGSPMNNTHSQIPAGSRLNQYLGAARAGPPVQSSVQLHVNAPPFIPKHHQQPQHLHHHTQQFSQVSLNDSHPPISNAPYGTTSIPPFGRHHHVNPPPSSFEIPNRYQQESRGGTTYFYSPSQVPDASISEIVSDEQYEEEINAPADHVLVNVPGIFSYHALPVPHVGKFRPKGAIGNGQTQFINPEFKMELLKRQLAMEAKPDLNVYTDIPQQVEHLTNLVPLENVLVNGISQSTYKASSIRDGVTYCIRRIHGFRVPPGKQTQSAESWKKLIHGNVVQLREIIPNSRAFEDMSVIFVYDYYPLAETLKAKHFDSRTGTFLDSMSGLKLTSFATPGALGGNGISESTLWAYVIQISAALRAIHSSGLAARSIDLNKIIVYGNSKLLLSFCGLNDIINPDHHAIHHQQMEDLHSFGCLLVALATGKPHGSRRDLLMASMNMISQNYSIDMKNLISYLLSTPVPNSRKSINEIMPMIGARFYNYMENMQQRTDCLEAELCKELENGRLFRLLCKMNTVLERVEHNGDENWSETGDRFMLKLFRDYVFHQVTDQGKPWLDMAHIIQCLNKLDAGTTEKIEMVSRDGNIQIIVDYAQLKRCLEKSFRDLMLSNVIPRH